MKNNYSLLIPSNYLYSDVPPLISTSKMVKDALNNNPKNMIGPDQTSREILENDDVPIFPVVLITPKVLRY